jgi:hypothetical protein
VNAVSAETASRQMKKLLLFFLEKEDIWQDEHFDVDSALVGNHSCMVASQFCHRFGLDR